MIAGMSDITAPMKMAKKPYMLPSIPPRVAATMISASPKLSFFRAYERENLSITKKPANKNADFAYSSRLIRLTNIGIGAKKNAEESAVKNAAKLIESGTSFSLMSITERASSSEKVRDTLTA